MTGIALNAASAKKNLIWKSNGLCVCFLYLRYAEAVAWVPPLLYLVGVMLRQYQESDRVEIIHLNSESVEALSPMDSNRFSELRKMCSVLIVAEHSESVVGFLMGFVAGTNYDSPNYRWFLDNIKDFLYIDRVVVSNEARGKGIGRKLYLEARNWAVSNSLGKMAAEINIEPPNRESLLFHKKLGFSELSTQRISDEKVVSLQSLDITCHTFEKKQLQA
jgi:predicted GNAT superfamily acetyltransferase